MNFTELQAEVMERANLTSATAFARVGRTINSKYREVATSIGLQTTARAVATAATVIGNRALTFGPTPIKVQKVYSVFDPASPIPPLRTISYEEMRQQRVGSGKASAYAIQLMGPDNVTVLFNNTPSSIFTWSADVEANTATLSGTQVPAFAESYHDLLVYAALSVELEKMEKPDMAKIMEGRYQQRLSELRLFIAEEGYSEMYQGKTERGRVYWP